MCPPDPPAVVASFSYATSLLIGPTRLRWRRVSKACCRVFCEVWWNLWGTGRVPRRADCCFGGMIVLAGTVRPWRRRYVGFGWSLSSCTCRCSRIPARSNITNDVRALAWQRMNRTRDGFGLLTCFSSSVLRCSCCKCTCVPPATSEGDDDYACTEDYNFFACVDPDAGCVNDDDITDGILINCGSPGSIGDGFCEQENNKAECSECLARRMVCCRLTRLPSKANTLRCVGFGLPFFSYSPCTYEKCWTRSTVKLATIGGGSSWSRLGPPEVSGPF